MLAEIITIGDEILIGQIVDTNSAWIGQQLNLAGIKVHQITSVSDNRNHIIAALHEARKRVKVILITGGLGPTKDDITKKTLCEYFNTSLKFSKEAFDDVEHIFRIRGREVTDVNKLQAEVPANSTVLRNKKGTAPGMWFEEDGCIYISMPGVPYEMKYLVEFEVLPRLKQKLQTPFILHHTLLTQGVGESVLAEKIEKFENDLPANFKLAYLPSPGMVRLRLSASGVKEEVENQMKQLVDSLSDQIRDYLFGYGEDSLESVVGRLLLEKNWTISTAESCTGGYVGHLLTSVPGSSAYFMGSTVTYSYKSKSDILGIPEEFINKYGAVSQEVVREMAERVRKKFGTDCAVATSGIAGPGGGTPDKPVGTVWMAASIPGLTVARMVRLGDDRLRTIQVAGISVLNLLRKTILKENLR